MASTCSGAGSSNPKGSKSKAKCNADPEPHSSMQLPTSDPEHPSKRTYCTPITILQTLVNTQSDTCDLPRLESPEHGPLIGSNPTGMSIDMDLVGTTVSKVHMNMRPIDSNHQKGYNGKDLPPQFPCEKSFVRIPHHLLEIFGYPRSNQWDLSICKPYIRKQKVFNPQPSSYVDTHLSSLKSMRENKTLPETTSSAELDCTSQIPHDDSNWHPIKAQMLCEAQRLDVSSTCASNKKRNPFNKDIRRSNDPILPVHDYKQTMKIVFKLYFVVTHGHGQFVNQQTKTLVLTFAYEGLETMHDAAWNVHQSNVDAVMMATKLFNRMQIEPHWDLASSSQEMKNSEKVVKTSESTSTSSPLQDFESKRPTKSMYPAKFLSRLELDDNANQLLDSSLLKSLELSEIDENQSHPHNYHKKQSHDIRPLLEEVQIQLDQFIHGTISIGSRESLPLTFLASSDESNHAEPKESYTGKKLEASTIQAKKTKKTTNDALLHGKMFCLGGQAVYKTDILFSPYVPQI
ncbi:hypothetical protein DFH28DRAFT_1123908 [Melampsora americana]|nr:hypothetical protein DFH28DRAFT_1123908 [Melampsora americana]